MSLQSPSTILELQHLGSSVMCPSIAIVRQGKMLIGLRHYTADKWKDADIWTVPGGRCEDGEKIESALRREIAEEVGMKNVQITRFLGVMDGAKEGDTLYLFLGTTDEEPTLMEPEKFSAWKWVDLASIPENFIHPGALQIIRAAVQ